MGLFAAPRLCVISCVASLGDLIVPQLLVLERRVNRRWAALDING